MGIAAFEFEWDRKLATASTVLPTLQLLSASRDGAVPFVHRRVATRAELAHRLREYTARRNRRYKIILIAGHGQPGGVVNDGDGDPDSEGYVCLDWLGDVLEGRLRRRLLFLSSCRTLDTSNSRLTAFVRQTGAAAVCGYRRRVLHVEAAAWELLFLDRAVDACMDGRGTWPLAKWARIVTRRAPLKGIRFRVVTR